MISFPHTLLCGFDSVLDVITYVADLPSSIYYTLAVDPATFEFLPGVTPLVSSVRAPLWGSFAYSLLTLSLCFLFSSKRRTSPPLPTPIYTIISSFHHLFLAILSGTMMYHLGMATLTFITEKGVFASMCYNEFDLLSGNMPSSVRQLLYWEYFFYVTKYWEYLDTVLIILKGKTPTLLHLFHHLIVPLLFYTFLSISGFEVWPLCLINSSIHTVMYLFYFLGGVGVRVPLWMKQKITQAQLLQFVVDMLLFTPHYYWLSIGICPRFAMAKTFVDIGMIVGVIFIFLFGSFYIRTYSCSTSKKHQ